MRFSARRLRAKAGALYGHVFEDRVAGVERTLFWAVSVPFEPVGFEGEEVRPLLQCEWMSWPLARWQELSGKSLAGVADRARVEASFYVHDHSDLGLETLELEEQKRGGLVALVRGRVDFLASDGRVEPFELEVETPLMLEGVRVVPANLRLGPKSPQEATALLGQLIDADGFEEPEFDGRCFLFRPRGYGN